MSSMTLAPERSGKAGKAKYPDEKGSTNKRLSLAPSIAGSNGESSKPSKFASLKKGLGLESSEEKAANGQARNGTKLSQSTRTRLG